MKIKISYLNPATNQSFDVNSNKIVFGRSLNADVTIKREEMSRYHFQIEIDEGKYFITDLNSSNGVYVNGEKIPANQKIPYNLIFPIEIVPNISISLQTSEEDEGYIPFEFPIETKDSLPASEKNFEESLTNTIQLGRAELPRSKNLNQYKSANLPKESKKQLSSQLILPLLVVLLIPIYIYFSTDNIEVPEEKVDISEESDPTMTKAKVELPKIEAESITYETLIKKNNCNELGVLCETIGLIHEKEGITFDSNKAILFVNLDHIPSEEIHKRFKDLPDKTKAEYYMAKAGTHDQLAVELKKRNPTHLIVVGFTTIDTEVRFKYVLNISFNQIPALDQGIHNFLFTEIFYGGKFKLYKDYVGYYTEFSEL